MKEISTLKNKDNTTKDLMRDKATPSLMTLNFLRQFARCYYVDKQLSTVRNTEFVLN